jgi:hypothetical protein
MTFNASLITRWTSPVATVAALANGGEHAANVTSVRTALTKA